MEALPKHQSTPVRSQSTCRSRVEQVTIDISTNASVDVSVEVPYKIHNPPSEHDKEIEMPFGVGVYLNFFVNLLLSSSFLLWNCRQIPILGLASNQ